MAAWKPQHPDDFPSLGWALLDWWSEHLPSPRDASEPLRFTDEQALQLVEWFRLHPVTGRFVYRRGYSRRSKGWGKSPVEAAKCIAELAGPVRFDGWDANGQPVGRPWGLKNDPCPWVQVAALSEDQTDNTWSVVYYFLTENDGQAADELGIDAGLTRCYLRDQPAAKLEPVTSAAGSRQGQPITYAVLDESHLMTRTNGGVQLARSIRFNIGKMGGRSYETTNSFIIGQGSVAELSYKAVRKGAQGVFADEVEAPHEIDGTPVNLQASDEVLLRALDIAYGGVGGSWWVDKQRLVADMRDTEAAPFEESAQFFLNWNRTDGDGWAIIPQQIWAQRAGTPAPLTEKGVAVLVIGPDQKVASLNFAAMRTDGNVQLEVVRHEAGTGWIVEACIEAQAETEAPIVLDPKSATASVLKDLELAGVKTLEITAAQKAEACAAFQNAAMHGGFVHLNAGAMNDALRGAEIKRVGEQWVWSQRASQADICPLEGATIAFAFHGVARLEQEANLW